MSGSQLSGVANASAALFKGARYFLTPTERTDPEDYREVAGFVRELGAVPTAVDPEKHDLLMAPSPTSPTSWPQRSSRSPRTSRRRPSLSQVLPSGT
jgi:hypothetical protein